MEALKLQPKLKEWHNLWFDEHKRTGYVAVTTDFKKHLYYGAKDVEKIVRDTKGKKSQFISINSFNVDWTNKVFSRETANLKQIRNIAVDIDQYDLGLTIDEALKEIQSLILTKRIPEPNLVIASRGIQIFYTIDRGASPELSWLTSYITEQLISKLKHVGADSNAKDMSRVMRVPNSVNERNNAKVTPYIWNDEAYSLQELQKYCRPLEKFKTRKQVKNNVISFPVGTNLSFFYQTNYARRNDLEKLIKLRKGNLTGMRNAFLYMYSYHQALVLNTQTDVLNSVQKAFESVYSQTAKRMSNREFETTVKSAYKDAEQFFKHLQENNYNVVYKANDGIKKPYKSVNAIEKLNITEDEQMLMQSLRSEKIAKKQHANYMRNKRRSEGMKSQEEYNNERKQHKQTKAMTIKELHTKGYNQSQIAEMTSVSQGYVSRILKNINEVLA